MFDFIFRWRGKHETVDSMFLMESPIPLFVILGFYLYFVIDYGPSMMFHKKPMNIRRAIIPYNIFQIFGCIAIIIGVRSKLDFKLLRSKVFFLVSSLRILIQQHLEVCQRG